MRAPANRQRKVVFVLVGQPLCCSPVLLTCDGLRREEIMRQSLDVFRKLDIFQCPLQILQYQSTRYCRETLIEFDKLMPLPTTDTANKAVSRIFPGCAFIRCSAR